MISIIEAIILCCESSKQRVSLYLALTSDFTWADWPVPAYTTYTWQVTISLISLLVSICFIGTDDNEFLQLTFKALEWDWVALFQIAHCDNCDRIIQDTMVLHNAANLTETPDNLFCTDLSRGLESRQIIPMQGQNHVQDCLRLQRCMQEYDPKRPRVISTLRRSLPLRFLYGWNILCCLLWACSNAWEWDAWTGSSASWS